MCNLKSVVTSTCSKSQRSNDVVIQLTVRVQSGDLVSLSATRDGEKLKWSYELGPGALAAGSTGSVKT